MSAMSQKRWHKTDKTNVQLHARHFNAAIAGTLSSVVAKVYDAVELQADPKSDLLLAKESGSSQLPFLLQPQPTGVYHLSRCGINCHTMSPLCSMLKDFTSWPILSLNLSNNQIGESGMKVLARALGDTPQLQRLDIRHNRHDGIKPLTSALAELGHRCWDAQPYKSKIYGIGWVCKRCGIPKAKHTTVRKLEHLKEFSSSLTNTKHQDIAALVMAISKGALPSLEHVNLDDFGHLLDLGLRRAIVDLKRAVAEKKASRRQDLKPGEAS